MANKCYILKTRIDWFVPNIVSNNLKTFDNSLTRMFCWYITMKKKL